MRHFFVVVAALGMSLMVMSASAQDEASLSFEKDIKPILETRCMTCHAPPSPKDDLDFSTRDLVVDGYYIAEGDPEGSDFFYRMITDDPDMLMPPPGSGNEMTRQEIALVKLWILEGAEWPEEVVLMDPKEAAKQKVAPEEESTTAEKSLLEKAWSFQGYFHPAVVHFPVALLSISAVFILLHWMFSGAFRDAAFYCLVFGAISSIVACTMGWALSPIQGYGNAALDMDSSIFRHRWCGIGVAALSCVVAVLAIRVRKNDGDSRRMRRARKDLPWQIGVFLCAGLVGITGHQGGELVYGESWYHEAFELFETADDQSEVTPDESSDEVGTGDTEPGTESDESGDDLEPTTEEGDSPGTDDEATSQDNGNDDEEGSDSEAKTADEDPEKEESADSNDSGTTADEKVDDVGKAGNDGDGNSGDGTGVSSGEDCSFAP